MSDTTLVEAKLPDHVRTRIIQRAGHIGFMVAAVHTPLHRDGFMIYYLSTCDYTGYANSQFGYAIATAENMTGPMDRFSCGVFGSAGGELGAKIAEHMQLLATYLGPEVYGALLESCFPVAEPDRSWQSSIAVVGRKAAHFINLERERKVRLLRPLGKFEQKCWDTAKPQFDQMVGHNSVMANLHYHMDPIATPWYGP